MLRGIDGPGAWGWVWAYRMRALVNRIDPVSFGACCDGRIGTAGAAPGRDALSQHGGFARHASPRIRRVVETFTH